MPHMFSRIWESTNKYSQIPNEIDVWQSPISVKIAVQIKGYSDSSQIGHVLAGRRDSLTSDRMCATYLVQYGLDTHAPACTELGDNKHFQYVLLKLNGA